MITIAITGGAACGKSYLCRRFMELSKPGKVSLFSCDSAVREIHQEGEALSGIREIGLTLGLPDVLRAGELDRNLFRELLFENSDFREKVEALIHPKVLRRVEAHLGTLPDGVRLALVEVPLLYEVGFPVTRNLDLVVGSSTPTQRRRLQEHRGLAPGVADRLLRSQLPVADKVRRADIVVWNDGDLESFEAQILHLHRRCENLLN